MPRTKKKSSKTVNTWSKIDTEHLNDIKKFIQTDKGQRNLLLIIFLFAFVTYFFSSGGIDRNEAVSNRINQIISSTAFEINPDTIQTDREPSGTDNVESAQPDYEYVASDAVDKFSDDYLSNTMKTALAQGGQLMVPSEMNFPNPHPYAVPTQQPDSAQIGELPQMVNRDPYSDLQKDSWSEDPGLTDYEKRDSKFYDVVVATFYPFKFHQYFIFFMLFEIVESIFLYNQPLPNLNESPLASYQAPDGFTKEPPSKKLSSKYSSFSEMAQAMEVETAAPNSYEGFLQKNNQGSFWGIKLSSASSQPSPTNDPLQPKLADLAEMNTMVTQGPRGIDVYRTRYAPDLSTDNYVGVKSQPITVFNYSGFDWAALLPKDPYGNAIWRSEMPNPDFVFHNKLPKAGSSTMHALLVALSRKHGFNYQKISPKDLPGDSFSNEKPLINFLKMAIEQFPLVLLKHHYPFNFKTHGMPQPTYINVMREPVAWFESQYYFKRSNWNRPGAGSIARSNELKEEDISMTIDECVVQESTHCKKPSFKFIEFFCGNTKDCKSREVSEDQIRAATEKAKQNIVRNFYVVGILEQWDETLKLFGELLPNIYAEASRIYQTDSRVREVRSKTKTSRKVYSILS